MRRGQRFLRTAFLLAVVATLLLGGLPTHAYAAGTTGGNAAASSPEKVDETEPNDSMEKPMTAPLGKWVYGKTGTKDHDWFKFTVEEQSAFKFQVVNDKVQAKEKMRVELKATADGEARISEAYALDKTGIIVNETIESLPAGTWYVHVHGSKLTSEHPYHLRLLKVRTEEEPNEKEDTATPVPLGILAYGNCGAQDEDYFKFDIQTTGAYKLRVFNDKALPEATLRISLVGEGDWPLTGEFSLKNNGMIAETDVRLTAGTWYAWVYRFTGNGNGEHPYHLSLAAV